MRKRQLRVAIKRRRNALNHPTPKALKRLARLKKKG
jgi:hypothetical protein